MGLPDTDYTCPKLSEDPRYGEPFETCQLATALAAYDRSDHEAVRVVIVIAEAVLA